MFLEMSFIQIFTRFFGDPVVAAGGGGRAFLFFAGLGSMSSRFLVRRVPGGVSTLGTAIAILVLIDSAVFAEIFEAAAAVAGVLKYCLGIALMAPLSFLMGVPFPWGLSRVHETAARAVPLAWAVNALHLLFSASAARCWWLWYADSACCSQRQRPCTRAWVYCPASWAIGRPGRSVTEIIPLSIHNG